MPPRVYSTAERRLLADRDLALQAKPPRLERNPLFEARMAGVLEQVGLEGVGFAAAIAPALGNIGNTYVRDYLDALDEPTGPSAIDPLLDRPRRVLVADRWDPVSNGQFNGQFDDFLGEMIRDAHREFEQANAARTAALDFLTSHLSADEREDLFLNGAFTVTGSLGGVYRIDADGRVDGLGAGGKVESRFCYHPAWSERVPCGDVALAHKLQLEDDEGEFLAGANRSPAPGSPESDGIAAVARWFATLHGQRMRDALPAFTRCIKDFVQTQARQALARRAG